MALIHLQATGSSHVGSESTNNDIDVVGYDQVFEGKKKKKEWLWKPVTIIAETMHYVKVLIMSCMWYMAILGHLI